MARAVAEINRLDPLLDVTVLTDDLRTGVLIPRRR
jgi:hypothetical protein